MSVPLLDLQPQYEALKPAFDAALSRVVQSQHFIMGPEVTAFEREVGAFLGATHSIACASGSDALLLALWALGIGPGDEVITTAFTFFATAGAVSRLGAKPVFVEIDPRTFNIDPAAVEAAVTPRTRAIIPVHLFGLPADMDALNAVASRHGLRVIEDAAQSIGATLHGAQTGTMGDFGCFSFFPSKNLGCWGDGGLVTAMTDDIAAIVKQLRVHGNYPRKYYHARVGCNSRLDAIQAAVLRVKLPHLAGWGEARRARVAGYQARIADAGIADQVVFQHVPDGCVPVYHQCVVRVPRRDALLEHLQERGIGCAVYYPRPLHLQECFADLGQGAGALPITEQACEEVIALPIFPELSEDQQDEVVAALRDFLA
jgi:dTDP-4-amino-4,6-dideoxygalactose transaminase